MDLTPAVFELFKSILIYIVPVCLCLLIVFFKSSFFKGWFGEFIINTISVIALDRKKYHLIRNVTLYLDYETTQIDQVIVSPYGIFVVETKNMKGWIFGGEKQPTWTQKIYKQTYKFQNPLLQNYWHVKALESTLQVDPKKLHSVVVFLGKATFKTSMPRNVTHPLGYLKFIRSKKELVFKEDEVARLIDKIEKERLAPTLETRREHIENLKYRNRPRSVEPEACPKCGHPMVLRTAKSGKYKGKQFWGCTEFPRCRGVKPAKQT